MDLLFPTGYQILRIISSYNEGVMMKKRFKKIYIEITNVCNLSCPFCLPTSRKKEYMSKENFEIILDKIKDYTDYIYLHVKGEPLMHPDINELIELAHQKGFQVNITTNGTLIDRLANKNIRQINYSLQSNDNLNHIREILRKIKKFTMGTSIYVSIRLWSDKSKTNNNIKRLLLEEFPSVEKIEDLQDKKTLSKNIFLSIEKEFEWPQLEVVNESSCGTCYALRDHIAILVDGSVVPCCLDNDGIINLGSIYHSDLQEILNTSKVKDMMNGFQNNLKTEDLCKKCNFKDRFDASGI